MKAIDGLVRGMETGAFAFRNAAALGTLFVVASCNGLGDAPPSSEEHVGRLGVELRLAPGVEVSSVSFSISRAGFRQDGNIPAPTSDPFFRALFALPVATAYSITVEASSDAGVACSGSGMFDILEGRTTALSLLLHCDPVGRQGSVQVDGRVNICPYVETIVAAPAGRAGAIALRGIGADADNGPSPLTYSWSASSGSFESPAQSNTTFLCSGTGTVTLTLTTSDGDSGCAQASATVDVPCPGPASAAAGVAGAGSIGFGGAGGDEDLDGGLDF